MQAIFTSRSWRPFPWLAALLLSVTASLALAQQEVDPPGRVAALSHAEGSVVFAPQGEEDWTELPRNRPLTSGDRVWTDNGARAELQMGSATLHLDSESHLGLNALDDRSAQFILMQGTVNARVRDLGAGENFEIDTPNLAFRASQPGDYRIDVDGNGRQTRVVVNSGMATVYGEGGQSVNLGAGQHASFAGRFLAQVQDAPQRGDAFARWADQRNRAEDQSVAARYVPRGVVGYSQLDPYGSWSQDPALGAVWYPATTVPDWAPYRYGQWTYVQPWGWTWVDDAPWGFAPFHYGRWSMIGSRWAWVPGRLAARPVYSPALVVFLGGGNGATLSVSSGPGVGWYPLAPGEPWYPAFRSSPRYLDFANFNIDLRRYPRNYDNYQYRRHPSAVTAVRVDDFRSGRPVRDRWQPLQPGVIGQAQIGVAPARPDRGSFRQAQSPRLQAAPPSAAQAQLPSRFWSDRTREARDNRDTRDNQDRDDRRDGRDRRAQQPAPAERVQVPPAPTDRDARQQREQAQRDQAQREQASRAQAQQAQQQQTLQVQQAQRAEQAQREQARRDQEAVQRQSERDGAAARALQNRGITPQEIERLRLQQAETLRQQTQRDQEAVQRQSERDGAAARARLDGGEAQRQQQEAARQRLIQPEAPARVRVQPAAPAAPAPARVEGERRQAQPDATPDERPNRRGNRSD
jgi:hypothetical protein